MILDKLALTRAIAACAFATLVSGCGAANSGTAANSDTKDQPQGKLIVVCTISTLCSLVNSVGGSEIEIHGIVPVGASPETYEPTPSDIVAVSHAAVLFENGLGLEAWLDSVLRAAAAQNQRRVVLSDAVAPAERKTGNPHLWMDPVYARMYVARIADSLSSADPAHANGYRRNAAAEQGRLAELDRWVRREIATIPPDHRAMICFHDAWYYFDRRYGIKNVGAVETSPGQEPSPGYFAHLIELAKANHVRAIFGEPQYSPKLTNALASGAGIEVVTNLYDDTLGSGPQLSNYEGMIRYDVDAIVKALAR